MEIGLDGKVALVTGASRGIGLAAATALADVGASVMLTSRKQDALDDAAAEIAGETATFAANAGEPDQIQACVDATMERFGRIDILVNNAATNPYYGPSIDIDLSRYDKTFQVNLRGPFVWTQAAWRASMADHGGSVVNIASIGAFQASPVIGHYETTKAALVHQTRILALDLAPTVRVNAIAPGLIKTHLARALWEEHEEELAAGTPMKRLGLPSDIANAVVFLCSDLASWLTGETIVVDGGATLVSTH